MNTRHLLCPPLLFLLSLGLVLGCGSNKSAPVQLSGKVTYNSTPLTGGVLVFYTDAGVYRAAINPDGSFVAADLPEGEATVTVDTESLNPNGKTATYDGKDGKGGGMVGKYKGPGGGAAGGGGPAPPKGAGKQEKSPVGEGSPQSDLGQYMKIPRNYADKAKSPLKLTLQSGMPAQNFDLKD